MKLGIAVSTAEFGFNAIVYNGTDIEKSNREIHAMGYHGVDLFSDLQTAEQAQRIRELYQRFNLDIPIYLPLRLSEGGGSFTHPDKTIRQKYLTDYMHQTRLASIMGASFMPLGYSRGPKSPDRSYSDYYTILADSLRQASEYAGELGIAICLEPINRYEIDVINSTEEAIDFIFDYQAENTKLLLDVFHMNIEDTSIDESILLAGSLIGHIHAADTNRYGAGAGHLDYDSLLRALEAVGYNGYLSIEAIVKSKPYACAKGSADFLLEKLSQVAKK